jgi:hypothetical protein
MNKVGSIENLGSGFRAAKTPSPSEVSGDGHRTQSFVAPAPTRALLVAARQVPPPMNWMLDVFSTEGCS